MTEYAPAAIQALFNTVKAAIPSCQMGGIVGDAAHTYGYHRGRNYVPGDDYSCQTPPDRQGDGEAASALDITPGSASDQHLISQRLLAAKNDSRMNCIREFYGSTDGYNVCGYDYYYNYNVTSDDSHLWHIHISVLRQYANDHAALQQVAAVITAGSTGGGGSTPPSQPPQGQTAPPWPGPALGWGPNDYFGDINGPNESHGGYYANERPYIQQIQQNLQRVGHAPNDPGWADGLYEQPTVQAVSEWQSAHYAHLTTRYGEVWSDDWQRLFTEPTYNG